MCKITHSDAHLATRLTESEAENDQWQKKLAETWTELAEERKWREELQALTIDQAVEIGELRATMRKVYEDGIHRPGNSHAALVEPLYKALQRDVP